MAKKISKKVKQTVIWGVVALVAAGAVLGALVMMSDNALTKAARAVDTITMEAEYNEADKTLAVRQVVEYKNRTGTALEEVKFHIYANAYREGAIFAPITEQEKAAAFPNGPDYGHISITSLAVGGTKTEPHLEGADDTVLCVHLPSPLAPNKKVSIGVDFTVKLANIAHRLGWTERAVNLGNFYPVPCVFENNAWQTYPYSSNGDPFYNAMNNFRVSLVLPSDYVVASCGTLQKDGSAGAGKKTVTYESKAIRDFAMVLSKSFKHLTRMVNKVAVNYYYLDDAKPEASLETSLKAFNYFSKVFTNYPYKQLSVVQTDFLHGGMEYGELVYISAAITENETAAARTEHDRVIVHEIAHQWWYGLVGNNQTRTAWLDEGLAEYSTLLFYEAHPEYDVRRLDIEGNARANYTAYVKIVKAVGAVVNPDMNRDLNSFASSTEYVLNTYVRGMLLFCDTEKLIGKEKMLCALSDVANMAKFTTITQAKLVDIIEQCTGTRLVMFFTTYLAGQAHNTTA